MKTLRLVVLLLLLPVIAHAGDLRKIAVTGKSETTVTAESAIVTVQVRRVEKTMQKSHDELLKSLDRFYAALQGAGIAAEDIRKSLIVQGKDQRWEKEVLVIKGYYNQCTADLHVRDVAALPAVYAALAEFAEVTVYNTVYERSDEAQLRDQEIEKALLAARSKAEKMARVLGATLGEVVLINEVSDERRASAIYSNRIEKNKDLSRSGYGEIEITALVAVEFELD